MMMTRVTALFPLLVLVLVPAGNAAADDDFDRSVAKAQQVSKQDVAALLWAYDGSCPEARDAADRRACTEVAKSLRERIAGRTYYLGRRPASVSAGQFDERKRSVKVELDACLFCEDMKIGSTPVLVAGRRGKHAKLRPLRVTSLVFEDAEEAAAWEKQSLPRLVSEVLVRFPVPPVRFREGDTDGVLLDVLSYRIYDRCTGKVQISEPAMDRTSVTDDCESQSDEQPAPSP